MNTFSVFMITCLIVMVEMTLYKIFCSKESDTWFLCMGDNNGNYSFISDFLFK